MNHNINPAVLGDLKRAVAGLPLTEEAKARLEGLYLTLARRPLVFRCPTPGQFMVGDPDSPVRLDCSILAAAGVQLALANPGRADLVRAADFVGPQDDDKVERSAVSMGNSVRNGIARFVEFLELNDQGALASLVLGVTVAKYTDGNYYLVAPSKRKFDLIT